MRPLLPPVLATRAPAAGDGAQAFAVDPPPAVAAASLVTPQAVARQRTP